MAINFLTCDAKAKTVLTLDFSYQSNSGQITHNEVQVDTSKVYKIQYVNNTSGLVTVNGRIISFTLGTTREVLAYISQDTKPSTVDTITIDCSDSGDSKIIVVNTVDLRSIEELATEGFSEIPNNNIKTFK